MADHKPEPSADQDSEKDPREDDPIYGEFKACAVDVLQVPEDKVELKATFAELDADSLDLVELVMALEEKFDITVDEAELEGVETVGAAFDLIKSKLDADSESDS